MGGVFEIPAQLALVLLVALGQPAAPSAPGAAASYAVAARADDNPYRFTAYSWLEAMSSLAADARFARYSRRIFHTSSGEAYVPVAGERREIAALKRDAVIARHAAEHYAAANAAALARALGRRADASDLYLAHVGGVRMAITFRRHLDTTPDVIAAAAMPELAEAVPALLFRADRGATVAEIAAAIATRIDRIDRTSGHRAVAHHAATRVLGWHAEVRR